MLRVTCEPPVRICSALDLLPDFLTYFFKPRNFDLIEFSRAPEFSPGIKAASGIFSISEIGAVAGASAKADCHWLARCRTVADRQR
jgi:hypothetical protein